MEAFQFWNLAINKVSRVKRMVLELAIIGAVVGAVLSRYKVMILVPTVVFSVILGAVVGVVRSYSLWLIVLITMVLAMNVQVGYLVGLAIQAVAERFQTKRKQRANLRALLVEFGLQGVERPETGRDTYSMTLSGCLPDRRCLPPPRTNRRRDGHEDRREEHGGKEVRLAAGPAGPAPPFP
jgi:hypothetical protein